MELSSTRILITGGASGIGQHISLSLLPMVERVFVLDRDQKSLDEMPNHPSLVKMQCDVTDPTMVQSSIDRIFEQHGGVNACLNNAGIIHSEPLINLLSRENKKHSVEHWQRVMDVNLNGVFYVASSVAEKMVVHKQKGVIINISSIAAQGNVGQSAYAASKAAVEALTKTWSKELGMFKIRCCCIAPGFFDTPSTRQSLTESMLAKWQKSVPLARLGVLDELLGAVEFIIRNDYFNGKVLSVDGGLTI